MKKEIIKILKDYLEIVKEHYIYDTEEEKEKYITKIKKIIKLLK